MSQPDTPTARQVLLVLRTEHSSAREIVRGVVGYGRNEAAGPWRFRHREPDDLDFDPAAYDGILASVDDTDPATPRLRACGTPVVSVGNRPEDRPWPLVTLDDLAIGRTAAEHLLDKQHRRIAFVGRPATFADQRLAGFREALAASRLEPAVFREGLDRGWLTGVEKPAAVFAANDLQAQDVLLQCGDLGVSVPERVAVLGVDNDDFLCETLDPPLSSIIAPHRRAGRIAAEVLRRRMRGEAIPEVTELPPGPVVERRSSDALAADDPVVERAVELIRSRVGTALNVAELSRALGVPRRTLEKRFHRVLGRSPLQVLHRHRLRRAVSLLIETNWPVQQIARDCGYGSPSRLNDAFRRHLGRTPSDYRQDGT